MESAIPTDRRGKGDLNASKSLGFDRSLSRAGAQSFYSDMSRAVHTGKSTRREAETKGARRGMHESSPAGDRLRGEDGERMVCPTCKGPCTMGARSGGGLFEAARTSGVGRRVSMIRRLKLGVGDSV